MSDTVNGPFRHDCGGNANEAVCIDVARVYDSCGSKDCLEDLCVYFSVANQALVDTARSVRLRDAEILDVDVSLEQMPFHRGYYSVRITYYFNVLLEITTATSSGTPVNGLAVFTKQTVLYGGEGSVRMYSSDTSNVPMEVPIQNLPTANVQTAEPISLNARLVVGDNICTEIPFVPDEILALFGGALATTGTNHVLVSLGLFSIVQITRNVQMLVHAYDFCIPCKECDSSSEDPCELFSKIRFPKNQFFPEDYRRSCCDDKKDD